MSFDAGTSSEHTSMPSLHFNMFPTGYLRLQKTYLSLERLSPFFLPLAQYGSLYSHVIGGVVPCICSVYGVTADPAVKNLV